MKTMSGTKDMPAGKNGSADHDELIALGDFQKDPYRTRGTDWTVGGKGVAGNEQSGREAGFSEGMDELATAPCGNRNLEDSGDMTPSVWGKGGKTWTVSQNDGESGTDGVSKPQGISVMPQVDLLTGKFVNAGPATRVGEIVDVNTHIPSR